MSDEEAERKTAVKKGQQSEKGPALLARLLKRHRTSDDE